MDSKRTRHATYHINHRFAWIHKDRVPVPVGPVAKRLSALLHSKASEIGGEVIDLAIQPDHVHLYCSFPPTLAPHQIMYRLKGFTAHALRRGFPALNTRHPNLWTRTYYVSTAGRVSAATVRRYVDAQKGHR